MFPVVGVQHEGNRINRPLTLDSQLLYDYKILHEDDALWGNLKLYNFLFQTLPNNSTLCIGTFNEPFPFT